MTLLKYSIAICVVIVVFLSINVSAQTLQDKTLNRPMTEAEAGNFFSPSLVNDIVGKPWRYGDGDVNHDGKTDSLDLKFIDSVDSTAYDQRDIDGDGVYTQHDKSLLQDYLAGEDSIPIKAWPEMTKEQKTSYMEKIIKIQNPLPNTDYSQWICLDFIRQMELELKGSSDVEGYREYLKGQGSPASGSYLIQENARFGLPIFNIGTTDIYGVSHSVCGVLVGSNPLNIEDWYFFGYEDGKRIYPGDSRMDPNNSIVIISDGKWAKGVGGIPFDHYGQVTLVFPL